MMQKIAKIIVYLLVVILFGSLHLFLARHIDDFIPSWATWVGLVVILLPLLPFVYLSRIIWNRWNRKKWLKVVVIVFLLFLSLSYGLSVSFAASFDLFGPYLFRHYHYPKSRENLYVYRDAGIISFGQAKYIIKRQKRPWPIMTVVLEPKVDTYWIPKPIEDYLTERREKWGTPVEVYRSNNAIDHKKSGQYPPRHINFEGEKVSFSVRQHASEALPGSERWLYICLDNITSSQVCIDLLCVDGTLLLGPISVRTGDRRPFVFQGKNYTLLVENVYDAAWSDVDSARFAIARDYSYAAPKFRVHNTTGVATEIKMEGDNHLYTDDVSELSVEFSDEPFSLTARVKDEAWHFTCKPNNILQLVIDKQIRKIWREHGTLVLRNEQTKGECLHLTAIPEHIDLPQKKISMEIIQRDTQKVPGTRGYLRLYIDDITEGHTVLKLDTPHEALLGPVVVKQGDRLDFYFHKEHYYLTVTMLNDYIYDDRGVFEISRDP